MCEKFIFETFRKLKKKALKLHNVIFLESSSFIEIEFDKGWTWFPWRFLSWHEFHFEAFHIFMKYHEIFKRRFMKFWNLIWNMRNYLCRYRNVISLIENCHNRDENEKKVIKKLLKHRFWSRREESLYLNFQQTWRWWEQKINTTLLCLTLIVSIDRGEKLTLLIIFFIFFWTFPIEKGHKWFISIIWRLISFLNRNFSYIFSFIASTSIFVVAEY